ncbi:hypothetical protein M0812_10056 [Anaeramoeba flamelloides]|uniref:Uncharacterized protein n=1 Tax=Anaeramoeba flamelloides TaxID=1746091 RepID=A0AAV7ZWC9_9EUKA|nr:hypothetical protein M0812_10056 [Anaeramoeba flamelloides]
MTKKNRVLSKKKIKKKAGINQNRISEMLKMGDFFQGLKEEHLWLEKSPKMITIDRAIFRQVFRINNKPFKLTVLGLNFYFLTKFNMYQDPYQENKERIIYIFDKDKPISEQYLEEIDEFEDKETKFEIIQQSLRIILEISPQYLEHLNNTYISNEYQLPNEIKVDPQIFTAYFSQTKEPQAIKSKIRNTRKSFTKFFETRFNLVNRTPKRGGNMIFCQNYYPKIDSTVSSNYSLRSSRNNKY